MVEGQKAVDESALAGTEEAEAMFAQRGCCCFWVPHFGGGENSTPSLTGSGVGDWERISGAAAVAVPPPVEPWWRRALMKVREWSEIVAGPRWKTLIRRFNRPNRWGGGGRPMKFQYDPLSYAMNFDEGCRGGGGSDDEGRERLNFSVRYVMPPSHGKSSSVELGGKHAPTLATNS